MEDRKPFNRFSVEELRRKREAELMKECTFQPRTNTYKASTTFTSSSTPSSSSASNPRRRRGPNRRRIEELARPRSTADEEKAKKEAEEKEAAACTFKPKINPYNPSGSRGRRRARSAGAGRGRGGGGGGGGGTSRIDQLAQPRKVDPEAERKRLEAELSQHTFHPTINPDTDAILDMSSYKPIHERIGDLQRARSENLQRLRIQAMTSNPELTFQPQINPSSSTMDGGDGSGTGGGGAGGSGLGASRAKGITSRMAEEAEAMRKRRVARQQEWEREMAAKHSFAPRISSHSQALLATNPHLATMGFNERQRRFERSRRAWVAEARRAEEEECSFKPSLEATRKYTEAHTKSETVEERVERLAKKDKQRVARARAAAKEEYYSQFTFEPELDPMSKVIGRATTLEELTRNDGGKEKVRKLKAEQDRVMQEECTFKPALKPPPKSVQPKAALRIAAASDPDHISKRVDDYIRQRAQRLAQARRELEYEQLKDCTFEPDTKTPAVAAPEGPVVVRGLGRFMERADHARRLEQEQLEREAAAFSVRGAVKPVPGPPTIPEPFQLSTDPRLAARRRRLAEERLDRELKECTFRPQTTEGLNHQLLQQLLLSEEM